MTKMKNVTRNPSLFKPKIRNSRHIESKRWTTYPYYYRGSLNNLPSLPIYVNSRRIVSVSFVSYSLSILTHQG